MPIASAKCEFHFKSQLEKINPCKDGTEKDKGDQLQLQTGCSGLMASVVFDSAV